MDVPCKKILPLMKSSFQSRIIWNAASDCVKRVRLLSSSTVMNKIIEVKNNSDFLLKVMNSDKPVIVNFHAEWCEPCHILTPKMTEMVEHNEDIDLAIIDVENHAELAHTFEVKAVPAVIAVQSGLVVDKFVGLVDATMIENLLKKLEKKKTSS